MNPPASKPHSSLRVLVIAPTPFFSDRGCHIRINEESQALLSRGHQLKILTYGLGKNVANLDIERIHHFRSYTKTSAGPSLFKILFDFLLLLRTIQRIRTFRPTVIHAHLHEGMCIAWIARLVTRSHTPILFDAQGSLVAELRNHMPKAPRAFFTIMHWLEKGIFRLPDATVLSSESLKKLVIENTLSPKDIPLTVAADSANPIEQLPSQEKSMLMEQYHIQETDCVVLYCGGMTADKGTDLLYEAMSPLLAADPSLKMVWIGGPEKEMLARAQKDHLDNQMIFLGSRPFLETHRLSQIGTIAIDPKPPTSSQASGKILNYMALSLPIVMFDSENRNMIDSSNFFASPATSVALHSAIQKAIQTPQSELMQIGKKNFAHLEKYFSWGATAQVLEDIYIKLQKD